MVALHEEAWTLSECERDAIVERAAAGISSMSFFAERSVDDRNAADAARAVERKAYARALVESQTTTGVRPKEEVEKAYLRILSQSVLDIVKNGMSAINGVGHASGCADDLLDLSQTGREFVTREMTEDLLAPMLKEDSSVSHIKLSTKSIGEDAAIVVAQAITNVAATLSHADISDIIAGRPEKEVLAALRTICAALAACNLHTFNISDNALGEKGIRACGSALSSQADLRELYLQNIGCSVHACAAVDELVRCTTLEKIHLFNNMSDDSGAESIASLLMRNPNIRDFRMVSSRVGVEGASALVDALEGASALVALDLSDNPLEPSIAPPLAALMQSQRGLRTLILNDVCLGAEGLAPLLATLADPSVCPDLEVLELALNEATAETAPALRAALPARRGLRRLNLAENELGSAGAAAVAAALRSAVALEFLDLRENEVGSRGAHALAAALCGGGLGREPPARSLSRVELNGNVISDVKLAQVKGAFARAFPSGDVLGSFDENDADADPDGEEGCWEEEEQEEGGESGKDVLLAQIDLAQLAL